MLSVAWTIAWCVVFFFTTWVLDLETTAYAFVCIFWVSIGAESIIRWAENTNFVAKLAKPHEHAPKGDNEDFKWPRAVSLFLLILVIMFFYKEFHVQTGSTFSYGSFLGQNGSHNLESFFEMIKSWRDVATTANVATPILIGTLYRAIIYKRSSQPARAAN